MTARLAPTLLSLLCLPLAFPAGAANVLLVTAGGSPTSQESLRKSQFEAWGHVVTTLASTSTQSEYDTALAAAELAWVTEEAPSANVSYKLRTTAVGVVCGSVDLDDEIGFSAADGYEQSSTNQIYVTSNDHAVASELAVGFITIFSSAQPRSVTNAPVASGLRTFATASSGDPVLAVFETGDTLANTYSGNSTASGRRVRLPWGGSSFNWSTLDADGLSIARNAILWAAGDSLLTARWKLDETSGTSAVDSGGGGFDGVYTNGVSLAQDRPYPGAEAPEFDGSDDHVDLPDMQADFSQGLTIAAWVKPSSAPTGGQTRTFINLSNGANVDEVWLGWVGSSGLQLYLSDTADGSSLRTIEDNSGFTLGRWVHCVATVDASGNATLYRNGQVTKSGFYTSLPTSVQRTETEIATSPWGDYFNGGLQDVRVYNRALSPAEVTDLHGLTGHWRLDEASGATAADDSIADRDGAHVGSASLGVEAVRSRGVELNAVGLNDRIDLPNTAVDGLSSVSVAWWMHTTHTGQTTVLSGARGNQNNAFLLYFQSATHFRPFVDGSSRIYSLDSIADGEWTHYVYQLDRASGFESLHIDGQPVLSGTLSASTSRIAVDSGGLMLAQEQDSLGGSFDSNQVLRGGLDDVRIYSRRLSDREIAEIYGLVGWWRMEETSGADVADSSGAGNHGVITGSATWSSDSKKEDGSLSLDGSDYVEIPSVIVDGSDGATLAGWARLTDADGNGAELISLGDHLAIRLDNPGSDSGTETFAYNGSNWEFASSGLFQEDSGWRHFASVYDKEELSLSLYIDGILRASHDLTTPIPFDALSDETRIGAHVPNLGNWMFTGEVDDMRVYNRPLTLQELQQLSGSSGSAGVRIVRWLEVANP